MKNPIHDPQKEIEDLGQLVSDALVQTKDGATVRLSDLEDRANRLCEYLLALPALEARPYAARLERLIEGMNTLEDAMASNFNALATSVGPLGPELLANR